MTTYTLTIQLSNGHTEYDTVQSKEKQPRRVVAANQMRLQKRFGGQVVKINAQKEQM